MDIRCELQLFFTVGDLLCKQVTAGVSEWLRKLVCTCILAFCSHKCMRRHSLIIIHRRRIWQLANISLCIWMASRQLAREMFSSTNIDFGTSTFVNDWASTFIVYVDIWWISSFVNRAIDEKIYNQRYTENVRYKSLSDLWRQWLTDLKRLDKLLVFGQCRFLGRDEPIIFLEQWCATHHSAVTTTMKYKIGSLFVRYI